MEEEWAAPSDIGRTTPCLEVFAYRGPAVRKALRPIGRDRLVSPGVPCHSGLVTADEGPPARHERGVASPWARLLLAVLAVQVSLFLISTLPGVRAATGFAAAGFDPVLDGWLQGVAYVTATAVALIRPLTSHVDRAIWAWLAAALGARALGFVLFLAVVRWERPPPYPSVADAAWLAMYGLMLAGLVVLARRRLHRLSTLLVLDAA